MTTGRLLFVCGEYSYKEHLKRLYYVTFHQLFRASIHFCSYRCLFDSVCQRQIQKTQQSVIARHYPFWLHTYILRYHVLYLKIFSGQDIVARRHTSVQVNNPVACKKAPPGQKQEVAQLCSIGLPPIGALQRPECPQNIGPAHLSGQSALVVNHQKSFIC